jgi:hypothetical protein
MCDPPDRSPEEARDALHRIRECQPLLMASRKNARLLPVAYWGSHSLYWTPVCLFTGMISKLIRCHEVKDSHFLYGIHPLHSVEVVGTITARKISSEKAIAIIDDGVCGCAQVCIYRPKNDQGLLKQYEPSIGDQVLIRGKLVDGWCIIKNEVVREIRVNTIRKLLDGNELSLWLLNTTFLHNKYYTRSLKELNPLMEAMWSYDPVFGGNSESLTSIDTPLLASIGSRPSFRSESISSRPAEDDDEIERNEWNMLAAITGQAQESLLELSSAVPVGRLSPVSIYDSLSLPRSSSSDAHAVDPVLSTYLSFNTDVYSLLQRPFHPSHFTSYHLAPILDRKLSLNVFMKSEYSHISDHLIKQQTYQERVTNFLELVRKSLFRLWERGLLYRAEHPSEQLMESHSPHLATTPPLRDLQDYDMNEFKLSTVFGVISKEELEDRALKLMKQLTEDVPVAQKKAAKKARIEILFPEVFHFATETTREASVEGITLEQIHRLITALPRYRRVPKRSIRSVMEALTSEERTGKRIFQGTKPNSTRILYFLED